MSTTLSSYFAPAFFAPSSLDTSTRVAVDNLMGLKSGLKVPVSGGAASFDPPAGSSHRFMAYESLSEVEAPWAADSFLVAACCEDFDQVPYFPTSDKNAFTTLDNDFFLSTPPASPTFSDLSISSPPPSPVFDSDSSLPSTDVEENNSKIRSSAFAAKVAALEAFLASSTFNVTVDFLSTAHATGIAFIEVEETYELNLDAARAGRRNQQSHPRSSPLTRCSTSFVPLPAFRTLLNHPLPPRAAGWTPPQKSARPTQWEEVVAEDDLPFRRDLVPFERHFLAHEVAFEEEYAEERRRSLRVEEKEEEEEEEEEDDCSFWSEVSEMQLVEEDNLELAVPPFFVDEEETQEEDTSFWSDASEVELVKEDVLFLAVPPCFVGENDEAFDLLFATNSFSFPGFLSSSSSTTGSDSSSIASPSFSDLSLLSQSSSFSMLSDEDASFLSACSSPPLSPAEREEIERFELSFSYSSPSPSPFSAIPRSTSPSSAPRTYRRSPPPCSSPSPPSTTTAAPRRPALALVSGTLVALDSDDSDDDDEAEEAKKKDDFAFLDERFTVVEVVL